MLEERDWLKVRDTAGRTVYINMAEAACITFESTTPGIPGTERGKVTLSSGEWVTVTGRGDVTTLRDWAEYHSGTWRIDRCADISAY